MATSLPISAAPLVWTDVRSDEYNFTGGNWNATLVCEADEALLVSGPAQLTPQLTSTRMVLFGRVAGQFGRGDELTAASPPPGSLSGGARVQNTPGAFSTFSRTGYGRTTTFDSTLKFIPVSDGGMSLHGSVILGVNAAAMRGTEAYNAWVDSVAGGAAPDSLRLDNDDNASAHAFDFITSTGNIEMEPDAFAPPVGEVFYLLDWDSLVRAELTGDDVGTNDRSEESEDDLDLPDTTPSGALTSVSRFPSSAIVAVPEPQRVMLLILGVPGFIFRRRRSRIRGLPSHVLCTARAV